MLVNQNFLLLIALKFELLNNFFMFLKSKRTCLVSLNLLLIMGCFLNFHSNKRFVKDQNTQTVLLKGRLSNGLYVFFITV